MKTREQIDHEFQMIDSEFAEAVRPMAVYLINMLKAGPHRDADALAGAIDCMLEHKETWKDRCQELSISQSGM